MATFKRDEIKIARVFPRRTSATPDDDLSFVGMPPDNPPEVDAVHVSVTWSYDVDLSKRIGEEWNNRVAPTIMGGPAMGDPGNTFTSGFYIKQGYTITSRGCPNKCWFCSVPRREGNIIRELPIADGWNVLDSNLLACSNQHIESVFCMLERQPQRAVFSGGLEASRLTDHIVSLLWKLRPDQMFFAYDTPDDLYPLIEAGRMLRRADFTRRHMRCYVLIGIPRDTFESAEKRLIESWDAGFMPMAMLWRNRDGKVTKEWERFQRLWARPALTRSIVREKLCAVDHEPKWTRNENQRRA